MRWKCQNFSSIKDVRKSEEASVKNNTVETKTHTYSPNLARHSELSLCVFTLQIQSAETGIECVYFCVWKGPKTSSCHLNFPVYSLSGFRIWTSCSDTVHGFLKWCHNHWAAMFPLTSEYLPTLPVFVISSHTKFLISLYFIPSHIRPLTCSMGFCEQKRTSSLDYWRRYIWFRGGYPNQRKKKTKKVFKLTRYEKTQGISFILEV